MGQGAWGKTGVDLETLRKVGKALASVPEDFTAHNSVSPYRGENSTFLGV